jgi:hypothetical protein
VEIMADYPYGGYSEDLKNINTFVLEYHTNHLRDAFIDKFAEWGFNIVANGEVWVDGIGVLFAEKPINKTI